MFDWTKSHHFKIISLLGFIKTAFNQRPGPGFQDTMEEIRNQNPNVSYFFPTTNKVSLFYSESVRETVSESLRESLRESIKRE